MALSDEAGNQMSSDDTSLRVSRKEDRVSSAKIIYPSGIRKVRLV
jgi:hypothetical protein